MKRDIKPRRRAVLGGGLGLLLGGGLAAPLSVLAQAKYPAGPVKILIGTPAGDSADASARQLAEGLQRVLGQAFFVENKPGAHGFIVAAAFKSAAADGQTLLYSSGGQVAINPALYGKKLPYDPLKDFIPVIRIVQASMYLYVDANLPIRTFKEWVDWVKARPGKVSYGSGGAGTTQHLGMEMLKRDIGLEMTHVPYRGSPMVVQDVIGGQIPFAFDFGASLLPHVRSGRVRLIGVASPQRSSLAPEVPTLAEQGVAGFDVSGWAGLFAPAGTPPAFVERLNEAGNRILAEPGFVAFLRSTGGEPVGGSSEAFRKFIVAEIAKWTVVVKDAGVQPE